MVIAPEDLAHKLQPGENIETDMNRASLRPIAMRCLRFLAVHFLFNDLIYLDSEGDSRLPRPVVPLPTQPPYTAHVGNLAFDLTELEVENYFEGCKVISVRIMKDRIDNRPKGFGYVEFADLDSLKKALSLADGQLAGRGVRVSVAEPRTLLPNKENP